MIASQIFYYIKRNSNQSAYAFATSGGITVPFFSSMELASNFLQQARVRGHGVGLISPTQMVGFSEACRQAGAKFLQLDPKPQVLRNTRVKDIGGPE